MSQPETLKKSTSAPDDWSLPEISTPVLHDTGGVIDLRQNAWTKGRNEKPATAATAPNDDEELILGHYTALHNDIREALKGRYKTLHESFNNASKPPPTSELDAKVSEAQTNVTTDIAKNKHNLAEARRKRYFAEQSRSAFKKANRLAREARYPESKLLHFAIILVIVLLECIANMYYFAQGNELGLLGGIFQAALISVANVGSAIMVGYFVARAATHVSLAIKLPAIAGLALYVAGIAAFNLLAGHYRDLMAVDANALEAAIPSMTADPFGLTFHSVLLFVTGLIAAALGIYKGMTVDDTYLGYGDVDRDYKAAAKEYTEVHEELQLMVLARMDHLREASAALRKTVAYKRETMEKCVDELSSMTGVYRDRVNEAASECRRQLKTYRQANVYMRVSPPPQYFTQIFGDFSEEGEHSLSLPPSSDWVKIMNDAKPLMAKVVEHTKTIDQGHEGLVKDAIASFEKAVSDIDQEIMGMEPDPDPVETPGRDRLKLLEMKEEA